MQRWRDDPRSEEIWSVIGARAERHSCPNASLATSFVEYVLDAKEAAEKENKLIPKIVAAKRAREKALNEFRTRIARSVRELPEDKLVPFLQSALDKLRGLEPMVTSHPRVRSDRKGFRPMSLFIKDISRKMQKITGKFLDKAVAVITEIAFDKRDITTETVRKARTD